MSEELFLNKHESIDDDGTKQIINELFEVPTTNATLAYKILSSDPEITKNIDRYLRGHYYHLYVQQTNELHVVSEKFEIVPTKKCDKLHGLSIDTKSMNCPDIDSFKIQGQNFSPVQISFGLSIDSCRNIAINPETECES
jgi:DNA-directed RNA polymerase subunit F